MDNIHVSQQYLQIQSVVLRVLDVNEHLVRVVGSGNVKFFPRTVGHIGVAFYSVFEELVRSVDEESFHLIRFEANSFQGTAVVNQSRHSSNFALKVRRRQYYGAETDQLLLINTFRIQLAYRIGFFLRN